MRHSLSTSNWSQMSFELKNNFSCSIKHVEIWFTDFFDHYAFSHVALFFLLAFLGSYSAIFQNQCSHQKHFVILWVDLILYSSFGYRYEDDSPTKVCLLDNACARWTTPAFDLTYLLSTSAKPEVLREHLQDLLEHYHQRFRQSLAEVGENPDIYALE